MSLLWVWIVVLACSRYCEANEPYCRQYDYDEKMLAKMIRTEIAMETLTKKLEILESAMEKRMVEIEKQSVDEKLAEKQSVDEKLQAASKDGGWSDWSDWTGCTSSCGGGIQSRYRPCDQPARYLNGKMCEGPPTEVRSCANLPCEGHAQSMAIGGKVNVPQRVGFTVKSPTSSLRNNVLQFSNIISNYGDDFNMATGKFVCNVPGLYFFSATILGSSGTASACFCYIHVGSKPYTYAYAHTKHTGDYPSGSASLVYELKTGDEVYLSSCNNYDEFNGGTHFSGILIQ